MVMKKAKRKKPTITKEQLKRWGACYHYLFLGKPMGDFYIDDKGVNADEFFE